MKILDKNEPTYDYASESVNTTRAFSPMLPASSEPASSVLPSTTIGNKINTDKLKEFLHLICDSRVFNLLIR